MKIKLNWKRLYPTDSMKCLRVKIDSKLKWKSHVNNNYKIIKLRKCHALQSKRFCQCKYS